MAILCSFTLFHERRAKRGLGVTISGGMFAMSAVLLMARAIYFLFAPRLTDLFEPSWVNAGLFVGCALSIAGCSIAWKELTYEEILMDLKDVESLTAQANRAVIEATELANSMAQRAAAADAARSEFLETVNQELQNTVGCVMVATDLLLDTDLTLEQQGCALALRTGAETLLKMNDDILDLSKIEAGRVVIESSAFDFRDEIEDALKTYAHLASTSRLIW